MENFENPKIESVYLYCQHTKRAGGFAPAEIELDADGYPVSDDFFLWGQGTELDHIAEARAELERTDPRPGGVGMEFRHKCAKTVLDYYEH